MVEGIFLNQGLSEALGSVEGLRHFLPGNRCVVDLRMGSSNNHGLNIDPKQ